MVKDVGGDLVVGKWSRVLAEIWYLDTVKSASRNWKSCAFA